MASKKDQAQLRKEVYDLLRANGLDVDKEPLHGTLSILLRSVYEKRVQDIVPETKIAEHRVKCPDCGKYRVLPSRNSWKQYKKRIPQEVKETIVSTTIDQ